MNYKGVMRESKRSTRENHEEDVRGEILEPYYPSWDMEELDLTARYKKVEKYILDKEVRNSPQALNINHYKFKRDE